MNIISSLFVSLGSSTDQLHDSLGSRQAWHVQKLVSVVKMATVLEVCTTEKLRSVVLFLWAKRITAKDIHKEMFHVYSPKCLSRKALHN
jgi:hypothetical protein